MAFKIYLSPSTQQDNKGAGIYGTEESRMNQLADVVDKVLKRHGLIVFRNSPNMTLEQVVKDSNSKYPDIHFAIHSNAGGGHGCEVFCHKLGTGSNGEKLAKILYNKISVITPSSDRGVKQGKDFYGTGKHMYELAYTSSPAALIEVAYHDNLIDVNWIIGNIDRIGMELAKGVLEYAGITYVPDTVITSPEAHIAGINIAFDKKYLTDKIYWTNKCNNDSAVKQLFINISKVGQ